jgi:predicted Zn-dependent peptidase
MLDATLTGGFRMRRRLALSWFATSIALSVGAVAQQVPVREETLANGMRLLMVERHDSPTVAAGWVVRVGSVNEAPGITGISHLFEHMMFKGTATIGTRDAARDARIMREQDDVRSEMDKEYAALRARLLRGEISGSVYDPANATPKLAELKGRLDRLFAAEKETIVKDELDQIYTANGASGLNAFTDYDQTVYFVTVPANKLELWFWLESDRLAAPVFREFYSERDVVREERRKEVESTPTGEHEEAFDAMFWQSSPYGHPILGWPSDVDSITRPQAQRYFATYYAPNNVTAILVGDFDPARAIGLARRYFGRIARGAAPPPEMLTAEVRQLGERRYSAAADTNPEVEIRYHAVPLGHRDAGAFRLLADLLNRRSGRLYRRLVEEEPLAAGEPSAFFRPLRYEGFFSVGAEVREGVAPAAVEAALSREVERLASEPVALRELQKVANQELANLFRDLQSNMSLFTQLAVFDSAASWSLINELPASVRSLTPADITRVAKRYLSPEARNVSTFVRRTPTGSETRPNPGALAGESRQ